jgi:HAD superfamily hydrolase (TIGR01509 family)
MIKIIAFDLMGVIFVESHIVKNLLIPLLGSSFKYEIVKKQYNLATEGKISDATFWESIDISNGEAVKKKYLNKFQLDPEFTTTIKSLKEKYQLGIISNISKDWWEYLDKRYKFSALFNPILISGIEKIGKPNAKLFSLFLERSSASSSEILFIDDKRNNLIQAHTVGFKTVWYKREEDDSSFLPDFTVMKFSDIKNVLINSKEVTNP